MPLSKQDARDAALCAAALKSVPPGTTTGHEVERRQGPPREVKKKSVDAASGTAGQK